MSTEGNCEIYLRYQVEEQAKYPISKNQQSERIFTKDVKTTGPDYANRFCIFLQLYVNFCHGVDPMFTRCQFTEFWCSFHQLWLHHLDILRSVKIHWLWRQTNRILIFIQSWLGDLHCLFNIKFIYGFAPAKQV